MSKLSAKQLLTGLCFVTIPFFIIFISSLLFLTRSANANGAAWNPGNISGAPGPIKQNDLILLKEYVLFDDDSNDQDKTVSAQFWIYNPTNKDIKITMGFPLYYNEIAERTSDNKYHEEYIQNFTNNFEVEVDDEKVNATPIANAIGPYTVVYTWEMSFPPMKTTEYSVEYPLAVSDRGADYGTDEDDTVGGSKQTRSFTYITHTGAYWAKPIHEATFEYCSASLIKFMGSAPDGETSEVRETAQTYYSQRRGWTVNPKPYEIDNEDHCIVWKRQDWLPKKKVDDIKVATYYESAGYNKKASVEDKIDQETLMNNWCGLSGEAKANHLGADTKILESDLTLKAFNAIGKKGYTYPLF